MTTINNVAELEQVQGGKCHPVDQAFITMNVLALNFSIALIASVVLCD